MKTVYFPYTHIDSGRAERMAAVWGALTLLQPSAEICSPEMASLREAGLIETVFPASSVQESLPDVLQELKQWAAQHAGGDLAVMMAQGQITPFFNSQSSAQIVAEIRKGGTPAAQDPAVESRNKVFRSQLVLAMAQEFDVQQAALASDIKALAAKENEMMALLKGEDAGETGFISSAWTPMANNLDHVIALRLTAWARAMAAVEGIESLSGAGDEILFLTDRRSVLAQIQDMFPEAEACLQSHCLALERTAPHDIERLPSWLADLLTHGGEEGPGADGGLSFDFDLVEIPRMSVGAFLLHLSGATRREIPDGAPQTASRSCWVGCMSPTGDDNGESVPGC